VIDWQFLEQMMFSGKQHALKIDNHHWGQYPQLLQIYWKCYDFLRIHSIRNQISIGRGGGYISVKKELV